MKTIRYILLSLAACSVLLGSCVKEVQVNGGEGVDVSILIATGGNAQTRSDEPEETGLDIQIDHFRVLIFDSKSGLLAHKFAFEPPATPQEINMKTGVYDFVLIANDDVDATTKGLLDALVEGVAKISDLNELSFASTSFDDDTRIPMVSVVRGVKVYPEDRIELPGRADQNEGIWNGLTKIWSVELERLAVRIDLTLDLDGHTLDAGAEKVLTIENVPEKIYLFQKNNYDEGTTTVTRPLSADTDGDGNIVWRRIILPESMFSDKENANKAVELSLWIDNQECTALIGLDTKNAVEASRNYTLPRNTYLDITATANPQQQALDCSATVVPWNDDPEQNVIVDGPYYLYVAADELLFTDAEGSAEITAETDYDLIDTQGYPKGIQASAESGCDWITNLTAETIDFKNYKIKFDVAKLENRPKRTAKIYLQTGNMRKVINVTQAFWGGEGHILYLSNDGSLQVDTWESGKIDSDNMMFFKFGSVIGFTLSQVTTNPSWAYCSPIFFNPSIVSTSPLPDYKDIPNISNAGLSAELVIGYNISDNAYHTLARVKAGLGDPCRLVGMTPSDIATMTTDEQLYAKEAELKASGAGGWRLPSAMENAFFVGGPTNGAWYQWDYTKSIYTYLNADLLSYPDYFTANGATATDPGVGKFPLEDGYFPRGASTLPAAGYRESGGRVNSLGVFCHYWSSTVANAGASLGYKLYFFDIYLAPVNPQGSQFGYAARCVRPVNNHLKY